MTGSRTSNAPGRTAWTSWTSCSRSSSARRRTMATVADRSATSVTLPADDQILITREFDAPRHLVYRAWTTPEFVTRWWAGRHGRMTVTEIDLRVGGGWRYALAAEGGFEVAFHGEYREIVPNERLVSTEVYEGAPAGATDAGD